MDSSPLARKRNPVKSIATRHQAPDNYNAHQNVLRVLHQIAHDILYGGGGGGGDVDAAQSYTQRAKVVLHGKGPVLRTALRGTWADTARWIRKAGLRRALFITVIGVTLLLALAGLSCFLLFFLFATANAVTIAFLASVATVGVFTGLFFTALTAIYIGALMLAVLAISVFTFSGLSAFLTGAGWMSFLWILCQGLKNVTNFIRGSAILTASALAAISAIGSTQIIAVDKGQP